MKEMKEMTNQIKDCIKGEYAEKIGGFILTYLEKLYDYTKEKVPKIKYQRIFDLTNEFQENFLKNFDSSIAEKKDYKNDNVFKEFDKNEKKKINEIINKILEKENIIEIIESKMKNDLNNLNLQNKLDTLNILLINDQKIIFEKFLKMFTNKSKMQQINDNEFSFNIKMKDNFKVIKNIHLIKYSENVDLEKEINCVWCFDKNNNEDEFLKKILEKNIPVIYIHQKEENVDNKSDIKDSHFIVDINGINNEDNNIIELIEKSFFNILIKNYEIYISQKSKNTFDNLLKYIHFESGTKIDNIEILIGQFIHSKIFAPLIFKQKEISNYTKAKYKEILINYKNYLQNNEKSYFSEFVNKSKNKSKDEIKDKNSKRNIKFQEKDYLTEEEKGDIELLDEIEHSEIKFIEQIPIIEQDIKLNKKNSSDFDVRLKEKFDDYFLEKASKYIIELIIQCIKYNLINYYILCTMDYFTNTNLNEEKELMKNEIIED